MSTARNGGEALRTLAHERVDLLITSLVMPVIDGLELLRHLANRRLAMPVLLLGGGSPEGELELASGAIEILPDPIELDRLVRRSRELLARPAARARSVGILDLVHLVAVARRTSALRATRGEAQGVLHFSRGVLVDAQLDDIRGEPAAREILGWNAATIAFDPLLRARSLTIHTRVDELLRAVRGAAAPAKPPPAPWERPDARATISQVLADAMTIEGALGAAIAVWELDHNLGVLGTLGPLPDVAVAGHCRVMRALLMMMTRLGMRTSVHDVLITVDEQLHILVPLPRHDELFLYMSVDRARGNLALTRHRVQKLLGDVSF